MSKTITNKIYIYTVFLQNIINSLIVNKAVWKPQCGSLVIFCARNRSFQGGLQLLGNKQQNQLRTLVKKKKRSFLLFLNHTVSPTYAVSPSCTCVSLCFTFNPNPL